MDKMMYTYTQTDKQMHRMTDKCNQGPPMYMPRANKPSPPTHAVQFEWAGGSWNLKRKAPRVVEYF